jgi:hypothetical protein
VTRWGNGSKKKITIFIGPFHFLPLSVFVTSHHSLTAFTISPYSDRFPEQDLCYKENRARAKSKVKNGRESESSFVICELRKGSMLESVTGVEHRLWGSIIFLY